MASKLAAESTLYHVSPKGFWKKFRDNIVVNPGVSSGLPDPRVNRFPPPGSRTETYTTPATKASDPAQNPYWKRDVRRAYPQLSIVTQSQLAGLLLGRPENQSVQAPGAVAKSTGEDVDLSTAIASMTERKLFDAKAGFLPPAFPIAYKKWVPKIAPDAPHDPLGYWPMLMYK